MESITERRQHERRKYVDLLARMPQYGTTCHGAELLRREMFVVSNKILDVGCGDNRLVRRCRELEGFAVGVDFADPRADMIASAHALPFADKSFDYVTAFDVLEHLLPDDIPAVLREIHRVSRWGFIASICTRDSKVRAADGSTLHPSVFPFEWWCRQLAKLWNHVDEADGFEQTDVDSGYVIARQPA